MKIESVLEKLRLPSSVNIIEVGPRDGFQNITEFIDTNKKIELINMLQETGLKRIEVTSFVNPKIIPQMRDAAKVFKNISKDNSIRYSVLIPNRIGAELALKSGAKELNIVISVSESHNLKNVGKNISQSLEELRKIKDLCINEYKNIWLRVSLATAFGCPYEGKIPVNNIKIIIKKLLCLGINEIILCDTAGIGNPLQVQEVIEKLQDLLDQIKVTVHFHNTRGNGMVNVFSALLGGIDNIESSIGGLGGCPFIPGPSGNVATEDLVNLLEEMNIKTSININKLLECVSFLKDLIKSDLDEYIFKSCTINKDLTV